MSRLLSAGYSRLWKNKVFWLEMGAVLVYAVVFMLNGCRQAAANGGIGYSLDQFIFILRFPWACSARYSPACLSARNTATAPSATSS